MIFIRGGSTLFQIALIPFKASPPLRSYRYKPEAQIDKINVQNAFREPS
jgi:hypothetical protein